MVRATMSRSGPPDRTEPARAVPGGLVFALVGMLLIGAFSAAVARSPKLRTGIIAGDAIRYYVYLRSAVFDGDLEFHNDYVVLFGQHADKPQPRWIHRPTVTGHAANAMSVGPAIVWSPFFLSTCAAVWIADRLGFDYPLDGYGTAFQLSAAVAGIVAATLGAYLTFVLCRRLFGETAATWAVLVTWLGSNALYYSLVCPTYSHAASMLVTALFFLYWAATRADDSIGRYAGLGALGGLCALVRWQDAVFLVVPAVDAVLRARQRRTEGPAPLARCFCAQMLATAVCALLVFTPQIAAWWVLYGRPFAIPQGEDWMQWGSPQLLQVLVSDWHGLFTWTPVFVLCVGGLALLARDRPELGWPLVAAFLVSLYANAAVRQWWAGEAFGARRFVSLFPVFAVGLAWLYRELRPRTRVALSLSIVIANGLLLMQYQLNRHGLEALAPYPRGFYGLVVARFVVPIELVAHWLRQ